MPQAVDHRRAIAERNAAGILDATERLLERGESLNMRAIAAEAGVSRPTLYAHYGTIADVFEAAVERGAGEHLTPGAVRRTHAVMMAPLQGLIERGRREGAFRTDLPTDWLATLYIALVHGADDHARAHRLDREQALE